MSYKERAEELGIKVDGRWSEERIKQEIDRRRIPLDGFNVPESLEPSTAMNILANRIYEGQGSMPDSERVKRIVNALKDKGYKDFSNLDIPVPNLKDHLKRNG